MKIVKILSLVVMFFLGNACFTNHASAFSIVERFNKAKNANKYKKALKELAAYEQSKIIEDDITADMEANAKNSKETAIKTLIEITGGNPDSASDEANKLAQKIIEDSVQIAIFESSIKIMPKDKQSEVQAMVDDLLETVKKNTNDLETMNK
ncbi:MAG: hypothetical protein IJT36_05650 [Alphaproteobacteria bacterium]|nr:hypothetical protein [Alphaproteobacteria bacterium]